MKTRLITAVCFIIWLGGIAPAFADNPLDVVLEGPWILYEDHAFLSGAKKVNVLIAMAPGVYDSAKSMHSHHPNPHKKPIFSLGDGFPIEEGIHCVGFDHICAKKRAAHTLKTSDYSKLLSARLPARWNWLTNRKGGDDSIYLILPMPDSLSNDGVYHMQFGKSFSPDGSGYGGDEQHSIGVQLHYKKGPKNLDLATCTPNGSSISDTDCTSWSEQLENTGTLQIVMKAPDVDDACDRHVRSAYPDMLHLIDPNGNTNTQIAYIDPAVSVKAGKGQYYVKECYQCDTQDPHYDDANCHLKMDAPPTQIGVAPLLKEIEGIITNLVPLEKEVDQEESKDGIPPDKRPPLYASRLKEEYDAINKLYPRLSQLRLIKLLLILSADNIHQTSILLAADVKALSAVQPDGSMISLDVLKTTEDKERTVAADVADAIPTKNGGDCRAPVMLVK